MFFTQVLSLKKNAGGAMTSSPEVTFATGNDQTRLAAGSDPSRE